MRKGTMVANPCLVCGKRFRDNSGSPETRKYCSLKCFGRSKRAATRVCPKCGDELLFEKFPLVHGRRARCCPKCYRPQGPPPMVFAPNPCRTCGKRFAEPKPPSRMARRLYCSLECGRSGKEAPTRRCAGCFQFYEAKEFRRPEGRRSDYCGPCREARGRRNLRGPGYMPPFNQAYRHARDLARSMKVPFEMTRLEAQRLYGTPCNFCGAPGCVYRPSIAGSGYGRSVVGITCWLCSRVARIRKGGLSEEELLAYGQRLVARLKG